MALPLPSAIVVDGAIHQVVYFPTDWTGPDDITHPAAAWPNWSLPDWEAACPGWLLLPLVDMPPSTPGKRPVRKPQADWDIGEGSVSVTYDEVDLPRSDGIAQCEAAIRTRTNEVAQSWGYDDIVSAISYAGDASNPTWQAEAIALRGWRSAVYAAGHAYIDAAHWPDAAVCLTKLPTLESIAGADAYRAMILRRADALAATNPAAALVLRQSVS